MLPSFLRLANLPEPYYTRMYNYYKKKKKSIKAKRRLLCNAPDSNVNDDDDGYNVYSDGSIYSKSVGLVYGEIKDANGTVLYSLPEPTGSYSKTSDHKFIMVKLNLNGLLGGPFIIGSANPSWEADTGPKIPNGSEAFLLEKQKGPDKREYFKNSIKTIVYHFFEKRMAAFFIQETNDRHRVITTDGTKVTLNSAGNFDGGYQSIIEALAIGAANNDADTVDVNISKFIEESNIPIGTEGSYYSRGTFEDYSYVAFSVKVAIVVNRVEQSATYPTLLTIWNHKRLGRFVACYGEDMGKSFRGLYGTIEPKNYGRPISCVHTEMGVNLINIQAPNEPSLVKSNLYIAIKMFLSMAQIKLEVMAVAKKIKFIWNPKLIILGGDFNDPKKTIRQITINDYRGKPQACLHYIGEAPLTCCTETANNTLDNHPFGGDYILSDDPITPITILEEYFT
jgi:hypothetical protein